MTEPTYTVWITTGTEALGGTDSNVFIMLFGENGQTEWIHLPAEDIFAFEEGSIDKFVLQVPELGNLTQCCLSHDNTADSGWYVENARVLHHQTGRETIFNFKQWIGEEEAGRLVICATP